MTSPAAAGSEAELGHELVRFAHTIHRFKAQMADLLPIGLDPAAAQLLAWLVKEGPSRQNELAGLTALDPSTVSRRVSQLVTHGLAERRPHPGDGRASHLVPTPLGQQLVAEMRHRRDELLHQIFAAWPDTDIAQLRRLVCRFNDSIDSMQRPAHPSISTSVPSVPVP